MRNRSFKYYMCDFETTVYEGQTRTDVWAAASVELFTEDVKIFHSIGEQFNYFLSQNENLCCFYHNLKFDGAFWIDYLLTVLQYKQAFNYLDDEHVRVKWLPEKDMPEKSFKYSISEMGQWYTITIKVNRKIIEIRDSLKLLPFSVKRIGESFGTKHKKLEMEYEGLRYPGCEITEEEQHYIANDVLVLKEALEMMFSEGHKKLTIGSCCLAEYKKIVGDIDYKKLFPNVYDMPLDENRFGSDNIGDWIRKSYKGGWCYLVDGKENKIFGRGTTADVNSLYPSMMSSESGNRYPIGEPIFWKGDYIPPEAQRIDRYYFVRIKTRFFLKDGYLPFIQIKNSYHYRGNVCLKTSDIYDDKTGKYYDRYVDGLGVEHDTKVTLTLTMIDYKLMQEHYYLIDCEILDGCYFDTRIGIFDKYINKYKKIKMESKLAKRESAKLFLNNLYGKMATNTNSSFKVAYIKEDGAVGFYTVLENNKKPGYIPVGSAITSYARNFTIRAAQKNYHGVDNPGFIYADTDSIHCDLPPEEIVGIKVDDKNFCCWKLESTWDTALFVRQKTYVEHVVEQDLKPCEPYYNIKCAGMPERSKNLFLESMQHNVYNEEEKKKLTKEEQEFIMQDRSLSDFKVGLTIPGKLLPKRIRGGVLLVNTTYEMRPI